MIVVNNKHWNTVKLAGVTVSVRPAPRTPYTVLRVASLVDTGGGQHMAILQNALPSALEIDIEEPVRQAAQRKKGLILPRKIAHLHCVYTGRSFGVVADVTEALRSVTRKAKLAAIVPDVMAPGDFMIFRHEGPHLKTRFAGVLRAVPERTL